MNSDTSYNAQSVAYKVEERQAANPLANADLLPSAELGSYRYVKRFFDLILALIFLPFLVPFFITISFLVKISSPGKIFFRQTRIGQYGRPFTIYKFRTMKKNAPPETATRAFENPDRYITPIGKFLRCTSLDELPQIFNILKGDMSFIGPRPLVLTEEDIHSLRRSKGVYNVKPGITGLAQISGRDLVQPRDKVKFDEGYLRSFSFRTDVGIFVKTIYVVLARKGVCDGNEYPEC